MILRIVQLPFNLLSLTLFRLIHRNSVVAILENNIYGHCILETSLLLKQTTNISSRKKKLILNKKSANIELTRIALEELRKVGWRKSVLANSALRGNDFLQNRMHINSKMLILKYEDELNHASCSDINTIYVPKVDSEVVKKLLSSVGVMRNSYITIMNRDTKYKKINENSNIHNFRNFAMSPMVSAIFETEPSVSIVRIGEPGLDFDFSSPKYYDLRGACKENPRLDLAIQSECLGYFGADSGPVWYPLCLGKPVGIVNMVPYAVNSPTDPRKLMALPMKIYSNSEKRFLTLIEICKLKELNLQWTDDYEAQGLVCVPSTIEEVEMFWIEWNMINFSPNSTSLFNEMEELMRRLEIISGLSGLPSLPLFLLRRELAGQS